MSKLENIQKIKENLENNLSSLLKTARAEIARKDKIIDDLRKRLDDTTFRRNNKNESMNFSARRLHEQHIMIKKYENISSVHSQENEIVFHQAELHHDEHTNKKSQNDIDRIPTVFGERLHKRIMEEEERKQRSLKLSTEVSTKEVPEENIVESDKENGSQSTIINNNGNESNIITQHSSSETSCRKTSEKRANENEDKHGNKRLRIEDNEDTAATEKTDFNYITRHDLKDNLAKFEDRLDAAHSFKNEEISFGVRHRAASEYQDTKPNRDYKNGWRMEEKNNSVKDYDSSCIRKGSTDSLRGSRIASTSNRILEGFNSDYKKSDYRYNSLKRSYSRSRSDYESSSSHHLRKRSSRTYTYRDEKYEDYKYNSRYRNDRLKRSYESTENSRKMKYRNRERGNSRDKSRHSSSDIEDRESSSSYKKYESRKIKETIANTLNDKKPHENNKTATEIDFRASSSRTIVNTIMNSSATKNSEQHRVNNESNVTSMNLTKSTTYIAMNDLNNLEEGEILDSPEKESSFAKISKDSKMEENNVKIVPVEDKSKDISVSASTCDKSISPQNTVISTKKLEEMTDISTKTVEPMSHLLQTNSKDEKIKLNSSSKNNAIVDEVHNRKDNDTRKSHFNDDLMCSTIDNDGIIEQVCDSNIGGDDKNCVDEKLKDSTSSETTTKIKRITDSDINNTTKMKKMDDLNIENVIKKEDTDNLNIENAIKIAEINNFNNDNSTYRIESEELKSEELKSEELKSSTVKVATKIEAVPNCDIEDKDKSQISARSETYQILDKSNVKTNRLCLSDHNYVQKPPVKVSDLDAAPKPSVNVASSERCKIAPRTATLKESKAKEIVNVQSVGAMKTISCAVKNKKDQQNKEIVISRRRKAVTLSDSNASMTILMNTNIVKACSNNNNYRDNDSILKPRACKVSRASVKTTCK